MKMNSFKTSQQPSQGKHVQAKATASEGSTQNQTPIFCFKHLGGKYCLSACEQKEKAAFADKLHQLSKLPWSEILRAHRHGAGCEIITRKQISLQLPAEATEDVTLLAFRFDGKKPMLGFRKNRVFHVLFLDRDFTLYQH